MAKNRRDFLKRLTGAAVTAPAVVAVVTQDRIAPQGTSAPARDAGYLHGLYDVLELRPENIYTEGFMVELRADHHGSTFTMKVRNVLPCVGQPLHFKNAHHEFIGRVLQISSEPDVLCKNFVHTISGHVLSWKRDVWTDESGNVVEPQSSGTVIRNPAAPVQSALDDYLSNRSPRYGHRRPWW